MPKLPMYVFKRANGSYRYKRNVPKDLREVIAKATVYRQLGNTYAEAMRNLPKVHAEIEALFDMERHTPDSQRALQVVKERLGEWHASVFQDGVVEAEWDVTDDFRELAMALKGQVPTEVVRQIGAAQMQPEPMTLKTVLEEYREFKAKAGEDNRSLKSRVSRISKDLIQVLGKNRFEWTPLENITRKDANSYRDYLLGQIAPNSVVRTLSIVKAAINTAINEHDLDCKNVFAGIRVKGSGASKTDRLPITEEQLEGASQDFLNDPLAAALFVTLRDTGCRVAEVTGLLVRDIDLEQQTLIIKSNDSRSLKTATSERTIPISNETAQHLVGFCSNKEPSEPLFTKYARPRGNDSASAMLMKRLRKTVSDPKVTIHSLRHRMKDRLRNTGCPEAISKAILGHSENSVAANYGSGYAVEVMREHMEKAWNS